MVTVQSQVAVAPVPESVTVQRAVPDRTSPEVNPVEVNDVVAEPAELIVMPLPPEPQAHEYV
jgi:hypothetical protein